MKRIAIPMDSIRKLLATDLISSPFLFRIMVKKIIMESKSIESICKRAFWRFPEEYDSMIALFSSVEKIIQINRKMTPMIKEM
jgi:hypothetical protein